MTNIEAMTNASKLRCVVAILAFSHFQCILDRGPYVFFIFAYAKPQTRVLISRNANWRLGKDLGAWVANK